MQLMRQIVFSRSRFIQQFVIQGSAFWRERYAALFNLTKTRRVSAAHFTGKQHRFFQCFETGLT